MQQVNTHCDPSARWGWDLVLDANKNLILLINIESVSYFIYDTFIIQTSQGQASWGHNQYHINQLILLIILYFQLVQSNKLLNQDLLQHHLKRCHLWMRRAIVPWRCSLGCRSPPRPSELREDTAMTMGRQEELAYFCRDWFAMNRSRWVGTGQKEADDG